MKTNIFIAFLIGLVAVLALVATDPNNIGRLPFEMSSTFLSLVNILGYSVIGFLVTTVVPDFYMDAEYSSKETATARAIHTLGLCLIYASVVFAFNS